LSSSSLEIPHIFFFSQLPQTNAIWKMDQVAAILGVYLPNLKARTAVMQFPCKVSHRSCSLMWGNHRDSMQLIKQENHSAADDDTASTLSASDSDLSFSGSIVTFAEVVVTEVHLRPYTTNGRKILSLLQRLRLLGVSKGMFFRKEAQPPCALCWLCCLWCSYNFCNGEYSANVLHWIRTTKFLGWIRCLTWQGIWIWLNQTKEQWLCLTADACIEWLIKVQERRVSRIELTTTCDDNRPHNMSSWEILNVWWIFRPTKSYFGSRAEASPPFNRESLSVVLQLRLKEPNRSGTYWTRLLATVSIYRLHDLLEGQSRKAIQM